VTLLNLFTATSTLASIIQQIHYATAWVAIKQAQYDKAVEYLNTPSLAIGGAAEKTDVVVFDIRKLSPLFFNTLIDQLHNSTVTMLVNLKILSFQHRLSQGR
jgi:hypothetical protein